MLDQFHRNGSIAALQSLGLEKLAMSLGPAGAAHANPIHPEGLGPAGAAHANPIHPEGLGPAGAAHANPIHPEGLGPAGAAQIGLGSAGPSVSGAAEGAAAGPGFWAKAKDFGHGQWGAAKSLASNVGSGQWSAAGGNLKTLAPSLLAGGALYLMHRHKENERARQQQMMQMHGGYGAM